LPRQEEFQPLTREWWTAEYSDGFRNLAQARESLRRAIKLDKAVAGLKAKK
jgi:hypothetical protein